MIIEILFIIDMVFWASSGLPQAEPNWNWLNRWFGFLAVLLLGLYLFVPQLRE